MMFTKLTTGTRLGQRIKGFSLLAHDFDLRECKILGTVADRLAAYEDTGLTPEQIVELKEASKSCEDCDIARRDFVHSQDPQYAKFALLLEDEQAGRIMRMEEGIKKAKQIFRNIEIITSCPETGDERNAMQMAIDGHRLMVSLLGGKGE